MALVILVTGECGNCIQLHKIIVFPNPYTKELYTMSHITDPDMFRRVPPYHQGFIRTLGKQLKQVSLCTHRSMESLHSVFVSLVNHL
jgi:hypothetical protein